MSVSRCCTKVRCGVNLGVSPLLGLGPVPSKIMVIGEAPTAQAVRERTPFAASTAAGRTLEGWLEYLGLARDQIYITNGVKCPVPRSSHGNGPDGVQVVACTALLKQELIAVQPKLVILLGSPTRKMFTKSYAPAWTDPFFRVWNDYLSPGEAKTLRGTVYFTLPHPSASGEKKTEYLDKLRQELKKLNR